MRENDQEQGDPTTISRRSLSPVELDCHLSSATDSRELLHLYPAINYLKLNRGLSATGACVWLFSYAVYIQTETDC